MFPRTSLSAEKRKRLFVSLGALVFVSFVILGVLAKNGWLDGKRVGSPHVAQGSTAGAAGLSVVPSTTSTPQLSKEYIHAGSRLLAVEDANANAAPPADLAIWRPSTGTWWVMAGGGSQGATQGWGQPTDHPVPGDYDGDGKTDFSVFRPSTGEWFYLRSSDNAWGPVMSWGNASDVRVPADFDGDGRTDRAVWRPADGIWYIVVSSTGAQTYQTYGASGDTPAPADYDGDGRADLALWRASNQTFYSINSSNGVAQSVPIGQSSSEPVSADYDGDGRADYAVRNAANWVIRKSSTGTSETVSWQNSGDKAVQNDYDGDGKCDIAVWRPTDSPAGTIGNWFIRQSASGNSLRQVQWGISGDIPVPALYRR